MLQVIPYPRNLRFLDFVLSGVSSFVAGPGFGNCRLLIPDLVRVVWVVRTDILLVCGVCDSVCDSVCDMVVDWG